MEVALMAMYLGSDPLFIHELEFCFMVPLTKLIPGCAEHQFCLYWRTLGVAAYSEEKEKVCGNCEPD